MRTSPPGLPSGRSAAGDERGFTLIEVVVGVAIMVMIAAAVTPNLLGYLDRSRVDRGVAAIESIATGIGQFRSDVNRYPGLLVYLSMPVTGGAGGDVDSCGSTLSPGLANGWAGPYLSRIVPAGGLPVFIGTAQNAFIRTPPSGGSNPTLTLRIDGVRLEDAVSINRIFDGDDSASTGSVQWTPAASGLVTLDILRPISGC